MQLISVRHKHRLAIKCLLPKANPSLPTCTTVHRTCQWHERECAEMFGITFRGHPDPRNILLPDDWVGFPLRKDYNIRLQDVEWVRKHLGIDSGQKYYVAEARVENPDYITPTD